jgi:hypothetical protein
VGVGRPQLSSTPAITIPPLTGYYQHRQGGHGRSRPLQLGFKSGAAGMQDPLCYLSGGLEILDVDDLIAVDDDQVLRALDLVAELYQRLSGGASGAGRRQIMHVSQIVEIAASMAQLSEK